MKKILTPLIAVAMCLFFFLGAAHARLVISDAGRLLLRTKENSIPVDENVTFGKVKNSDMLFAAFGPESMPGVPAGLYLFKNRKLAKRLDIPEPDLCFALSLSPNGSILAVDSGTSVVREWTFYSLATGKKVGNSVTYVSGSVDLSWMDNERVLVTYPDGAPRECQTEQCSPLSVGIFNISTGKMRDILKGSDRCDFTLLDVSPAVITAEKLCLESRRDWAGYTGGKAPEIVSKSF